MDQYLSPHIQKSDQIQYILMCNVCMCSSIGWTPNPHWGMGPNLSRLRWHWDFPEGGSDRQTEYLSAHCNTLCSFNQCLLSVCFKQLIISIFFLPCSLSLSCDFPSLESIKSPSLSLSVLPFPLSLTTTCSSLPSFQSLPFYPHTSYIISSVLSEAHYSSSLSHPFIHYVS